MSNVTEHPGWLAEVTPANLKEFHIPCDGAEPIEALTELAAEHGVEIADVTRCLDLLRRGSLVIRGTEDPVALIAYSPRRDRFAVVVDGDIDPCLFDLTISAAGVWLLRLAAEAGGLPADAQDEAVCLIGPQGELQGADTDTLASYRQYRDGCPEDERGDDYDEHSYEAAIARAFWRCAAYSLETA